MLPLLAHRPYPTAVKIEQDAVTENDLEHLLHFLEGRDEEMEWQNMMARSIPNMAYQAWLHEPEVDFLNFDSYKHFCHSSDENMQLLAFKLVFIIEKCINEGGCSI